MQLPGQDLLVERDKYCFWTWQNLSSGSNILPLENHLFCYFCLLVHEVGLPILKFENSACKRFVFVCYTTWVLPKWVRLMPEKPFCVCVCV